MISTRRNQFNLFQLNQKANEEDQMESPMGPPQAGNNPTDIVACATCPSPSHAAAATLGFSIPAVNMVNTHKNYLPFLPKIFSLFLNQIIQLVSVQ